jgi:hypothetical protein
MSAIGDIEDFTGALRLCRNEDRRAREEARVHGLLDPPISALRPRKPEG